MSRLLDVPAYALRHWTSEFPALEPKRGSSGQATYSESQLEQIRRIKELLYDEGYTIPGARKKLAQEEAGEGQSEPKGEPPAPSDGLIWAAGDKAGGAALHLSAAERAADRIEAVLDEVLLEPSVPKGRSPS